MQPPLGNPHMSPRTPGWKTPAWQGGMTPNVQRAKTPAWQASSRTPNPYLDGGGGKTPRLECFFKNAKPLCGRWKDTGLKHFLQKAESHMQAEVGVEVDGVVGAVELGVATAGEVRHPEGQTILPVNARQTLGQVPSLLTRFDFYAHPSLGCPDAKESADPL
jgi:transcription elongation factor